MAVAQAGEPPQEVAARPCAPPDGWEQYVVQPDDTLFAFVLGAGGTLTVDDLMAANCLTSRYLRVDQTIYLPPGAAENAPPSVPSGPATDLGARGPRTPNCPCTITVGTGWRREQIADAINAAQTLFTGGDFLAATGADAAPPFDFTAERPPGSTLEGFLFPGTYIAQNDTTAEQFRDMLLSAFAASVTPQMRADAAAQGVSFYQALIIASIVQRETRAPEMQPLVASVLYNRLRDGNRLAQTVTVQYALGGPGNWWPRVTASGLQVDSPYNSYTRRGLPPGPIDSPGLSAIMGSLLPGADRVSLPHRCLRRRHRLRRHLRRAPGERQLRVSASEADAG
ncbi:MAG: endolytic transglycosylase MltG [Anaerolineae bacterium]|nr:endolytic transglycosylase MltG [Anaerolineae bacterium]